MDFGYYKSFLHDGTLHHLEQVGDQVMFDMSSAQLSSSENKDLLTLDAEGCFRGQLIVSGIMSITVNRKRLHAPLKMECEDGEVASVELEGNMLRVGIIWFDYSEDHQLRTDYSAIELSAQEIRWVDERNDLNVVLVPSMKG